MDLWLTTYAKWPLGFGSKRVPLREVRYTPHYRVEWYVDCLLRTQKSTRQEVIWLPFEHPQPRFPSVLGVKVRPNRGDASA